MKKEAELKKSCFIISPIGESGSPDRKNANFFRDGIVKPAFAEFADFEIPIRADDVSNPGMITDDIINKIFDADIVIADISNLNANVFYELGIRHAANRPTIHCAIKGTPIPFDNKGYSTIFYDPTEWDSVEETRRRISESVRRINTPDYKSSNPVTHALATKALLASADPKEKIFAELISRIEKIENENRINSEIKNFRSSANAGYILGESLQKSERREQELIDVARSVMSKFNRPISSDDIKYFATSNTSDSNYNRILQYLKSNDLQKIINMIDIPF